MSWQGAGKVLLSVGLIFWQTSVSSVNWLLLMAVWLGTSKKWGQVFLIGLGLDLAAGGRLGLSSLKFLIVAAGAYLISERLKWQRGQGEIKLKVE